MGIKGLMSLIREKAPDAIKSLKLDMLTGNVIACDASMVNKSTSNSEDYKGNVPVFGHDTGNKYANRNH